jgi:hypothetical protein
MGIKKVPLSWFSILLIERVHIGTRALLDIKLIWFGYMARLSQWERGEGVVLVLIIILYCGGSSLII